MSRMASTHLVGGERVASASQAESYPRENTGKSHSRNMCEAAMVGFLPPPEAELDVCTVSSEATDVIMSMRPEVRCHPLR